MKAADLDKSIFTDCFSYFAVQYSYRYDHTYIGLAEELAARKSPGDQLSLFNGAFPFTECVIFEKCDKGKMAEQLARKHI
jgi:hypothetical protein